MMLVGYALPLPVPYMCKISRKQQTIRAIQRKKKKNTALTYLELKRTVTD